MKSHLLYLIFFLTVLFSQSCKRGDPCSGMDLSDKVFTYSIPDSNKTKIPYTGRDTLILVSDGGDTATFIGAGKNTIYNISSKNIYPNPDCPRYEKKYFENFWIKFTDIKNLNRSIRYLVYLPTENDIISIQNSTNLELREIIDADSKVFAFTTFEMMSKRTNYDDSIPINGVYQKGYYIDANRTVLYSHSKGLLKYKDINLMNWTLVN
jgi:hypothetical protein